MTFDYLQHQIGDKTFCVVPINGGALENKTLTEQVRFFHNIATALDRINDAKPLEATGQRVLVWQNYGRTAVKHYPKSEGLEDFTITWAQVMAAKKFQVEVPKNG